MTEQKKFLLSDPEQCELERQADIIKREQTEGRYTLRRAAQILYSAEGERINLDAVLNVPTPHQVMLPHSGTSEGRILDKLAKAAISQELKSYWPGDKVNQEGELGYGVICNVLEVYADDLNHWIENNQPRIKHRFNIADAPPATNVGIPKKRPQQQQQFQEQEILRVITELGYSAYALPKVPNGKKGVKAEVRGKLKFEVGIFNKAWERLRSNNDIRDAS